MFDSNFIIKLLKNKKRLLKALISWKLVSVETDPAYDEDGLSTFHIPHFLTDEDFVSAYSQGEATGSWDTNRLRWRVHIALCLAKYSASIRGDYIECGVNLGGNCRAQLTYIPHLLINRNYYLVDTFSGIPSDSIDEVERRYGVSEKHYTYTYDRVCQSFADHERVKVIRGRVPAILDSLVISSLAFVHLDMNVGKSEYLAAKKLWPLISPGGVLLLDDVCYSKKYTKTAEYFSSFARDVGSTLIFLPTGQGLILKSLNNV